MNSKIIVGALISILLINCSPKDNTKNTYSEEAYIHKIKLTDLSGQNVDWSNFVGKKVIVNVWATWCKPCIEEMPSLEVLKNKLPTDEYVLMIASSEDSSKISRFLERNNYQLDFYQLQSVPESLGIYALPTTFIIDEKGELLVTENGMRDWGNDSVVKEIMEL